MPLVPPPLPPQLATNIAAIKTERLFKINLRRIFTCGTLLLSKRTCLVSCILSHGSNYISRCAGAGAIMNPDAAFSLRDFLRDFGKPVGWKAIF